MNSTILGKIGIFTVLLALLASEPAAAEDKRVKDVGEFSFISTSGNTEVFSFFLNNKLTYQFTERFRGKWEVGLLYGEESGSTSAEEYQTELRLDYSLADRAFSYASTGYRKDDPAGIRNSYLLGLGAGLHILAGPRHVLTGEAGFEYRAERYTDITEDDIFTGRIFVSYEFYFSEKNRFHQTMEYLPALDGFEKYYLNSETALISALNNMLSLKAGYLLSYDSDPAVASKEDTDSRISIALILNI